MKRFIPAAIVACALFVPQPGSAMLVWSKTTCGGATLTACGDFELHRTGLGEYRFRVTNALDNDGVITAVGMYDRSQEFSPVEITGITTSHGQNWTENTNNDHCHLTGGGGGRQIFAGCASADASPIANGIAYQQWVEISFTLKDVSQILAFEASFDDVVSGRAHFQSIGDPECSIKIDSQTGAFSDGCKNGVTVPEPGTMLLLGTGLAGVLGTGVIRRRREDEVGGGEAA